MSSKKKSNTRKSRRARKRAQRQEKWSVSEGKARGQYQRGSRRKRSKRGKGASAYTANYDPSQPMTNEELVLVHSYGEALRQVARTGYSDHGRGAVVADLRGPESVVPIHYEPQARPLPCEEWRRMVSAYNPQRQLVVVTITDDGVTAELFTPPPQARA